MSSVKAKALEVISMLPDDIDSQQLIHRLMQVLRIQSGLKERRLKQDGSERLPAESLWGTLRGSVHMKPSLDLTQPVLDDPW